MPKPSSYVSGMTDSFHQVQPRSNMSPGVATGTGSGQAGALGGMHSFSRPIQAQPTTNASASSTTSGPSGPKQIPFGFKVQIPSQVTDTAGAWAGAAGNMYNQYQNPIQSGFKNYLRQPANFAHLLGALSPVASPLLRTAGLPLLMGAYSYLHDPGYLNALTAGKFPKMGAAAPAPSSPVAPTPPPARPIPIRPAKTTGALAGGFKTPNPRLVARPLDLPAGNMLGTEYRIADDQKQNLANSAVGLGVYGLGGMASSMLRNPALQGAGARVAGSLGTAVDLMGVSERLAGRKPEPFSQKATTILEGINPFLWQQNLLKTIHDRNMPAGQKALQTAGQVLGNPATRVMLDPVGNAAGALQGISDWTGAGNALYAATGGQYGTAPEGPTMGVPAAISRIATPRERNLQAPQGGQYRVHPSLRNRLGNTAP